METLISTGVWLAVSMPRTEGAKTDPRPHDSYKQDAGAEVHQPD